MENQPDVTGMWNLQPFRDGLIAQAWDQQRSFLIFYDGAEWSEIELPDDTLGMPYHDVQFLATSGDVGLVTTVQWSEGYEPGPEAHHAWLIEPGEPPRETSLPPGLTETDDTIGLVGSDEGFLVATAQFGSPRTMTIWFSPNGEDWTELAATTTIENAAYVWNLQRHHDKLFVVGEGAETNCGTTDDGGSFCQQLVGLWSSPDGADWERVFTTSGENTDTPMGAPALFRSWKSVSDMDSTACLLAL